MRKQELIEKIKKVEQISNFKGKSLSDETLIAVYNKTLCLKKRLKNLLIEENPKASTKEIEKILLDLIKIST